MFDRYMALLVFATGAAMAAVGLVKLNKEMLKEVPPSQSDIDYAKEVLSRAEMS